MSETAIDSVEIEMKTSPEIDLEQSEDHIRVIARFRPINAKEKHEEKMQNLSSEPISLYNNSSSVSVPRFNKPSIPFTLDKILWTDSTQQHTFDTLSKPLIDQVMKGYNCSIFAFGQTGSGKTYTMFGPDNYSRVDELGIIPRSVDYLFSSLSQGKDILNYQVTLSVIEIYKEQTRDLLNTAKKKERLEIFVSGKDVFVKHLIEQSCKDVDELLSCMVKAIATRNTKRTEFIGHESSRSHCVVMISVMQRLLDDTVKTSKMNFADLAGSELAARTGASGDTLKEAGKIHQGLLALENVINALVEGKKHIPYKDSNLTRILKDSLGGNSKTTLLVACSPHIWNRRETVSVLRFASRAKKIKNKAKVNQRRTKDQMEQRIRQLQDMNGTLKKQLTQLKKNGANTSETVVFNDTKVKETLNENERLKELLRKERDRIQQMEKDLKAKDDYIDEMNNKYTKKTKQLQKDIHERDDNMEDLRQKLDDKENDIQRLTTQLQHDEKMQSSFNDHKTQLKHMVNVTMADQTTATVAALSELQKQQEEFYKFMKSMQSNIDKVYNKQMDHDKKFEEIQIKEANVVHNYHKHVPTKPGYQDIVSTFDYDQDMDNSSSTDSMDENELKEIRSRRRQRLSTASVILPELLNGDVTNYERHKSEEALDFVINSMTSYLERQRTGRLDMNELKQGANTPVEESDESNTSRNGSGVHPLNVTESVTNTVKDDIAQYQDVVTTTHNLNERKATDHYTVGARLDILDSSYHWYSAKIVDIDPVHQKALKVHYDGFDDKWDEWIPFTKTFRIALHATKSQGNGKKEGGVHALIATKYGTSRMGKDLRLALHPTADKLLSEVNVLIEGYLFKRGNWNKDWKKRWFVLRSSCTLFYYESRNRSRNRYRGVIALGNIRKIMPADGGYTEYSFDIQTPARVYNFSCLDESELKDWMSVLECLMNNSLESIAPKTKKVQQLLGVEPDPNRFKHKHRKSKTLNFYKLTKTRSADVLPVSDDNVNGTVKNRTKRTESVMDRIFKRRKTSITNKF